ncbi:HAD-IA family hydrolase [Streptomyces sp. NPDC012510]|uniref:HAD family hydrolase n=1 Tax=Streptomyces sp. NPDC012510 TaxID=3364838 RepID=UPI0036F10C43
MSAWAARHGIARRPTRAVLFDFSGTLFDDTSVITADRLVARCAVRDRKLGTARARELCAGILAAVDSPEGQARRARADLSAERHRRVWTGLAASAVGGDTLIAEAFYDCVIAADGWRPYPDTPGVLSALHEAGIPTAVVSNTGWDIRGSFARSGLTGLVADFVLSCEVGIQKPDTAIFRAACDRLGVMPGDALMVGDDAARDGAATAAGIPAYILPADRSPYRPRGLAAVLDLLGRDDEAL